MTSAPEQAAPPLPEELRRPRADVNQSSGGSDLLLLAIAGALVIGSISNGMDLLALESSTKYMVTGGVLALAVVIDAVARQRRQAEGRV